MQASPQTNHKPKVERRFSVERRCWKSRNRSLRSANSSFTHLFGESKGAGCSLEGRLLNVPPNCCERSACETRGANYTVQFWTRQSKKGQYQETEEVEVPVFSKN
jgi:hypothetical protein